VGFRRLRGDGALAARRGVEQHQDISAVFCPAAATIGKQKQDQAVYRGQIGRIVDFALVVRGSQDDKTPPISLSQNLS
jgi:hypothetical protein